MRNSLNSSLSSHPLNNQFQRMLTNVARSNFHALPLGGAMRNMPHQWKENFENLSKNAAVYDVSYAGTVLDSFFSPKGALANAQEAAASAFGANEAFFTSCGTTISNRIALEALSRKGRRVLMDAASHQSMSSVHVRLILASHQSRQSQRLSARGRIGTFPILGK